MAFSAKQVRALQRNPDHRCVRTREVNGRELTYLEGWYVISEANRIFGFDGWSRETTESRCVLARESHGNFLAVYVARVRIAVQAQGSTIIREGHGTGEGRGTSAGEVHDVALKAAETDATKRALATFGKPFGLELYRNGRTAAQKSPRAEPALPGSDTRLGFHPDDITPVPRPSTYYGRRRSVPVHKQLSDGRRRADHNPPPAPPLAPFTSNPGPGRIDKSTLALPEPKRLRDKGHLRFVASQPCLICGRQPSDPHHLRFAQPRAIGMKVSDEFTVPLCRGHHRQLHQVGDERVWWTKHNINALEIARKLWEQTHPRCAASDTATPAQPNNETESIPVNSQ